MPFVTDLTCRTLVKMTPIFFALYLIFTCCTFSRTQTTAAILQETMGSDLDKFVHEISSELKKLKEEHTELRRIVHGFAGNQEEVTITNSQGRDYMRLKREENGQVLANDLKEELMDRVEELDGFKADPKMIHSIQKDLSSMKEKLKSIEHEQGMMKIWRKKILMTVKELKLFERESNNIQLKGRIKNGFISSHDESVLIIDSSTQKQDEKENKQDQKDEAEMVLGSDINESEDRSEETPANNNDDAIDGRHGRKNEIKNKKESMMDIVKSKRTVGQQSACSDCNKEMIRKSASIYNAFTARFSNDLRHLSIGQAIVFDDIYLNLGNGYDRNSGIFRAPVAGLYIVLMTISSSEYNTPDVELVKNGSPICSAVVWIDHGFISAGSPCNVLVQLGVGDEVWARVVFQGNIIRGKYYSTFSMALLVPNETSGSSS